MVCRVQWPRVPRLGGVPPIDSRSFTGHSQRTIRRMLARMDARLLFAPGTGDDEAPEADLGDGKPVTYKVRSSSFIQAVAGVNYTGVNRWVVTLTGGHAFLLRENLVYVEGSRRLSSKSI